MKIANTETQVEAEIATRCEIHETPEDLVIWSHVVGRDDEIKPFLEYTYEDSEFESFIRRVQEIFGNEKEHREIISEYKRQLEEANMQPPEPEDWCVDLQKLADVFAPWEVPEELVKLAKYQNRKNDHLIFKFYILADAAEEMLEYTDYSRIGKDKLKLFASIGDGDLIGYWVKKSIEKSPIVYVNMDGDSCLIASNMREFIQTLISANPDAIEARWDEVEFEFEFQFAWLADDKREFNNFKRWAKRNLDILPIEDRLMHARAAKKKFGKFDLWLERNSE